MTLNRKNQPNLPVFKFAAILLAACFSGCQLESKHSGKAASPVSEHTESLEKEIARLRAKLDALLETNAKPDERLDEALRQINALRADNEQLRRDISELKGALNILTEQLQDATRDSGALRQRCADLEKALAALEAKTVKPEEALAGAIDSVSKDGWIFALSLKAADGVKEGDVFEVSRGGVLLGTLRVTDVFKEFCSATVLSLKDKDKSFAKGDGVKRVAAKETDKPERPEKSGEKP